jgi:tRNA(adenine34) deaminase
VVFGAFDPKIGAAGSVLDLFSNAQINHQTQVSGGVLADECATQLKEFFRHQRQEKSLMAERLRDDALRTPASCFDALPPVPGEVRFFSDLPALDGLRLHVADTGPPDSKQATLCLHGARSWSLVWRHAMCKRAASGERVLAVDLIGFGKSDKLKKLAGYTPEWHLQVLLELLDQLGIQSLLVLEAAGDCLPGKLAGQTLGQALTLRLPGRVVGRESVEVEALEDAATNVPYPDQGHRAALRTLATRAIKP